MKSDVNPVLKRLIKNIITENLSITEKYSKENSKVLNLFKQQPSINDFDVKNNWSGICDYMESQGYLRYINSPNSPADADEMERLDPIATWNSLDNRIKKGAFDHVEYERKENRDKDSPTTDHMELVENKPLPPTTWLIHYTNNGEAISKDGFQIGFSDENRLGLTAQFYGNAPEKQGHGYNFAFIPNESTLFQINRWSAYGKEIVMFQSSGIVTYHPADREKQIVFYGASIDPSNIVLLRKDGLRDDNNKETWIVVPKQGGNKKGLFRGTDIQCVGWVKKNFQQYKRAFISGVYNKETQKIKKINTRATSVDIKDLLRDINGHGFIVTNANAAISAFTNDDFVLESQADLKKFLESFKDKGIELAEYDKFDYDDFEEATISYKYPIQIIPNT